MQKADPISHTETVVRPREANQGIADDRAVRTMLFATVKPMASWQREAAHLRALLDKSPKPTPEILARIFSLRHDVNAARLEVTAHISRLPLRLQHHGRVRDISGALARLDELVAGLE